MPPSVSSGGGRTVLVAGAAGFIGSHVVERLRAAGHAVRAIDRPGADLSAARAAGAQALSFDLGEAGKLREALAGCDVAVNGTGLFDLAATEEELRAANVTAAVAFAEAAREAGVGRLVHLSSASVYGKPARSPQDEEGPFHPRNLYEITKLEGERAVQERHGRGIEVAVLRPTLVYGPRSRYGQALFVALLAQLRAFGRRRFPLLAGGPLGQHVHVADVAGAAVLCATHPDAAGRAFNVADREPLGLGETFGALIGAVGMTAAPKLSGRLFWGATLFVLAHLPARVLREFNRRLQKGHEILVSRGLPDRLVPRLDRDWIGYFSGDFVFDVRRLASLGFSWEHPDFRRSIGGVVEWYRGAGWLPAPDSAAPGAARAVETP